MTAQWAVLLHTGDTVYVYGPTEDEDTAREFAEFLTAEVDPAEPVKLRSPTRELLAHWRSERDAQTEPLAEEGIWPPRLGDTWQDRIGDRWLGVPGHQLLHLPGRNGAAPYDEIWRLFGPLTLVSRIEPTEAEVPF